ncbi:unnamed protein product [Rotaria magnacalcarata]|uniref:F-box domain-containing protein n=2 Tax=Rotaria magnacalcarata TaxID=392030 RepID=A0A816LAU7_9BILA|nr:unnamed protein product [Rotaria magnacalcarata]
MTTYFDRLPVELLHMIFQFLSDCDVIWSFFYVSPYLDAVVNNYNYQKINFQSISKTRFDFVCNHLNLPRIISLTLSNDSKTPGQVELFFNRFKLQDFISLRVLTIISVTSEDINPILSDLPKLPHLTSLITECRSHQSLLLGQVLNQLKSLQHLSVSYGDIFDHNVALPLRNLKELNAGICNFLELRRLQMIVPALVSLKINLQANHQLQLFSDSDIWSSLQRLDLTLNHETTITFTEIQQLLYRFHKLTHLTLNVRGLAENLANGYLWETCSAIIRLRTFHFIIEFDNHPLIDQSELVDEIFRSFSTPFWLDVKKWYIFITTHGIYTTSCYDEQAFILPTFPPLSTSPDCNWFYSKTKRIQLDDNILLKNLNKFYNLEQLDLSDEHLLSSIDNINQFIHLRHLIIHENISNKILGDILLHNPHINHLTISQNNFNQLFPFKTIRYLHIQNTIKIKNRTQIKQLSRIFPSIRRLFMHVSSMRLIYRIINSFQHLDNGVFECQEKIQFMLPEWLKENTRLKHNTCSFTWRREQNKFLLWINDSIESNVPSNNGIEDSFNVIEEQRSDKCSLQ